jgi:hypothetical protein
VETAAPVFEAKSPAAPVTDYHKFLLFDILYPHIFYIRGIYQKDTQKTIKL